MEQCVRKCVGLDLPFCAEGDVQGSEKVQNSNLGRRLGARICLPRQDLKFIGERHILQRIEIHGGPGNVIRAGYRVYVGAFHAILILSRNCHDRLGVLVARLSWFGARKHT